MQFDLLTELSIYFCKNCYISFAIYYRLCSVLQIKYFLSFGSKLNLLPKLNCPFQCRYRILDDIIQFGFHRFLPIVQSQ